MTPEPARRILVLRLGALGDFILSTGAYAAIRRHHPAARIVLLTTPPLRALGEACPWFDEVRAGARPEPWRPDRWWRLGRWLRAGRFDRVYDLQTSDRSGMYYRLLALPPGRPPEWSGVAAGCSHPDDNPARDRLHTVERQAGQLARAGIADVGPPDLSWLDGDIAGLAPASPFVLLVPGGAAHRPAKRWPAARYGALAAGLIADGRAVAILGGPAEATLAAEIVAGAPGAVNLAGRTDFGALAALARRALAAVGNDTGPMHILAAAGCPSVVLFSAESDPALCAPRGPAVTVLRRDDLADLDAATVAGALAALAR